MFDFGKNFSKSSLYFSKFLKPRKAVSLNDFFEFGLLPAIPGIYRQDYLNHIGIKEEEKSLDAVFITHAHTDHTQDIHFLRNDIPIYCSEVTKIYLEFLESIGGEFTELSSTCEEFEFYINTKTELSRVTRKNKEYVKDREFHIMRPTELVKIGSLMVEMVPVDHSLPGSSGYIVYSSEGIMVLTGDIRFHGINRKLSFDFLERVKKLNVKWLLCEGTRINDYWLHSEEDVLRTIGKIISNSEGLVFAEYSYKDLDRTKTFYEAAKKNGRKLVINLKEAALIKRLGNLSPVNLDDVKIFIPLKGWAMITKRNLVDIKYIQQDYEIWQREFLLHPNSITFEDLQKNPSEYVMSMNIWEMGNLVDIQPKNAVWIKSSCEPFSEEMELDEDRKKNWLKHFKIKEYHAHASGHACAYEIKRMIRDINPEILIPIHTEHPELFRGGKRRM